MYRLNIIKKNYEYNKGRGVYEDTDVKFFFTCYSTLELMGLIEKLVKNADETLTLEIDKEEDEKE